MTTTSSTSRRSCADGTIGAAWTFTNRADGDLSVRHPGEQLDERRSTINPLPWTWLRQVHGSTVVVVDEPGAHCGVEADAAVTATPGAVLVAHSADCPPVLFVSSNGVIGAAHAGWRGLAAGVLQNTVAAMSELGSGSIRALLGPCIHPGCYEFGSDDLDEVVAALGPTVASTTSTGTPALDLVAGVRAAVEPLGVVLDISASECSACTRSGEHARYFSHRARREDGRQAGVIWLEEEGSRTAGTAT